MQIWGLTDPGNIRQQNQDTYEIVSFGHDRALMIVCDGMGGAKSGNIASSMAAEPASRRSGDARSWRRARSA